MTDRPDPKDTEIPLAVHLGRIARELTSVRQLLASVALALTNAEAEIPERMRRFANYAHDVHDIKYMYEEHGVAVPKWVHGEVERCDDRFRHILEELHSPGEVFEKVKRDMAGREGNRYDHTKALFAPKGTSNETGSSQQLVNGKHESGAEEPSGTPGVSGELGDHEGEPL